MNVMLISQCNKRALVETRRILDQFAERKGNRTWQTAITQKGLMTLRKLLRKTARRNTAVACHWIKTANRTELLWIVGNVSQFNELGTVPTNTTRRDVLKSKHENLWNKMEEIALLAGIAALFHDFGKAIFLFQKKLRTNARTYEPYRHEWISLRLFQAFVGELSDEEWLKKMMTAQEIDEQNLLSILKCDGLTEVRNPFKTLPPLAGIIGWLIVSHHRLPKWPGNKGDNGEPKLKKIDKWLNNKLAPSWNSDKCLTHSWSEDDMHLAWQFNHGLPLTSSTWQLKAYSLAQRALKRPELINGEKDWMKDPLSMHLSRMFLMLSDHLYSAQSPTLKWQDKKYKAHANTDRDTGGLKQKLDEHLVGVSHYALLLSRRLPLFSRSMPTITRHRGFKKRSEDQRFRWQDKAYELACSIKARTSEQGFFGVNMASTGCGKTFANGRIMYGLANESLGCRFNVALGLRTLTLQTGEALRDRLNLQNDDLAILIGSQAVRRLHNLDKKNKATVGSESSEELFGPDQYVSYEGAMDNGPLSRWLQQSPGLHQLVSAPILVSTIDYLMPATEGERGGRQIGPMLRLLTSDLVLDEPDDFGLGDLPALCRLVNWAGLLGARVLLSSATLPPSLIEALFEAYLVGRHEFQSAYGEPGRRLEICCAWFDEDHVHQSDHDKVSKFMDTHLTFVDKRVSRLQKKPPIHRGQLLPVQMDESILKATDQGNPSITRAAVEAIARVIHGAQYKLHAAHGQTHPETDKKISIGLVRMSNINPMVAVAQKLFNTPSPADHRIHYCVYHGQHPLAVRSTMEQRLDTVLDRHDSQKIWHHPEIKKILTRYPENHHLFIVIATSVAEVGRDHDYDWAIAEPSSMRSIIQLAGRIQRHRKNIPSTPNVLVLSHNYKTLIREEIAFNRPGFESKEFKLSTHDLHDLVTEDQLNIISAIPRIIERKPSTPDCNLADLEHAHLADQLFGDANNPGKAHASLWWNHNAHWSFELQRRTPFRQSAPDIEYVLYFEEEGDKPLFNKINDDGMLVPYDKGFERVPLELDQGVSLWGENEPSAIITHLAVLFNMEIGESCRRFGVIRVREQRWLYHSALGVHGALN
jgi:CRISPR-associated endonuclease/helicase Cas3